MTELFKKPSTFTRIEFWAITAIFAFGIFFFIIEGLEGDDSGYLDEPYKKRFDMVNMQFVFTRHYLIPHLIRHFSLYFAVVALNFVIIPKLLKKEFLVRNIILIVLIVSALGVINGITGTYLYAYRYVGNSRDEIDRLNFIRGFEYALMVVWMLTIYTALKYSGMYLLSISEKIAAKYKFIRKEAIVAAVIWMLGLFFLRMVQADREIITGFAIVIPFGIGFYLFAFYRLIPSSLAHKNYQFFFYLLKSSFILFVSFIVIYFLFTIITGDNEEGAAYSAFNSLVQLVLTVPVSWALYKRHLKGNEEINVLQKELKRSSASVDFLRSQINPHFLFNALNTLYGTAIQENADRTSEGIQKLGDMMRFMLQENMQNKISLGREIEYLNNYIDLQKLRTGTNTNIQIQTEIHDQENYFQISPMLLIPFVENAFKHGISFREPSHIKITLEVKDNTLYFDVYNSKHTKNSSDPEKDKSGIGLENVKQRLKLSYPNKHELIIRDTTKEFFVHLTIQLSKFA